MASLAVRLMADPVRELAFGFIGLAYSALGTPMTHPVRFFVLQNYTDTSVMISLNGVDDHLPLVPNGSLIMDITANKTITQGFFLSEGQQFFVKQLGAVATSGSVYLTVFYGADV